MPSLMMRLRRHAQFGPAPNKRTLQTRSSYRPCLHTRTSHITRTPQSSAILTGWYIKTHPFCGGFKLGVRSQVDGHVVHVRLHRVVVVERSSLCQANAAPRQYSTNSTWHQDNTAPRQYSINSTWHQAHGHQKDQPQKLLKQVSLTWCHFHSHTRVAPNPKSAISHSRNGNY
jgi:hypothetical protein